MRSMTVVPAGRHMLTPYRRLFNQVAPVVAYGLARDAYQLGRTYLHVRASNPSRGNNIVSNTGNNRVATRSSTMVQRRGYKRRRTYRSKRRRFTRFRRRRRTRYRRIPRNRFRKVQPCVKLFSRHFWEHIPVLFLGDMVVITTQCPNWTDLPTLSGTYSKIYDQWKPLKMICKYTLIIPSKQLSNGAPKVHHWWVFDPDGNGKKFLIFFGFY